MINAAKPRPVKDYDDRDRISAQLMQATASQPSSAMGYQQLTSCSRTNNHFVVSLHSNLKACAEHSAWFAFTITVICSAESAPCI